MTPLPHKLGRGDFLEGTWNVYDGDRAVGTCSLSRQGLYCRILCRCSFSADGICRLKLKCGRDTLDIGILVPTDGGFGLDKRVAAKSLPDGKPEFYIQTARERNGKFVPVRPEEAFSFLSRLSEAKFGRRGGEVGVLLPEE